MIEQELDNYIGKYVILSHLLVPRIPFDINLKRTREIRKLVEIRTDELGRVCAWLGRGVVMDMSTKEILAGSTDTDPIIPCPTSLIYKVVGKEIDDIIETHFANQKYFINGSII